RKRVTLEPADQVPQGEALFNINPAQSTPLDARSHAQAEAVLARAEASLRAAHTLVEAEQARSELADKELARVRTLVKNKHLPADALDRSAAEARRTNAGLRSARFAVEIARHELENAQATLAIAGGDAVRRPFSVSSPVSGVVLTRQRQSEGSVQVGEPMLTLGDLASLEVE